MQSLDDFSFLNINVFYFYGQAVDDLSVAADPSQ